MRSQADISTVASSVEVIKLDARRGELAMELEQLRQANDKLRSAVDCCEEYKIEGYTAKLSPEIDQFVNPFTDEVAAFVLRTERHLEALDRLVEVQDEEDPDNTGSEHLHQGQSDLELE